MPVRCLACSHRFLAVAGTQATHKRSGRPAALVVAAVVVVLAAVGGVAWLLWPEAQPGSRPVAVVADAASVQAQSSLEEAAQAGDADAQFRLGRAALLNAADDKKAAQAAYGWLKQAANSGHGGAMLQLGKLYRSGVGMPQNFELAEKWIRAAAEAGDSDGMVELGRLYRSGLGVDLDPVLAYVWFNRAAAAHNMEGVHERESIALKLTPEELKLAQAASLAADDDDLPAAGEREADFAQAAESGDEGESEAN